MEALLYLLIYIVVLGLVVWLVLYVLNTLPVAEPFNTVARVVVIAVACIILIVLLLQLVPFPHHVLTR